MMDAEQLRSLFPIIGRDIIGIMGVALLSYGGHLVYHPLGYIVPGLCCLAYAIVSAQAEQS